MAPVMTNVMTRGGLALGVELAPASDLKQRIVEFVSAGSTEITPGDVRYLPELTACLPAGTDIYVAHTPVTSLQDVVHAALAVQRAGFAAMPHIAARRIANAMALRHALMQLHAGGVQQILLVGGDASRPTGEFSSTLEILDCGALEDVGLARIGVAGHPEGHKAVGPSLLWEALATKQAFAERLGVQMHIVSQFGFNANALAEWGHQLPRHQIDLPVHVGIAGPAALSRLIHFAMKCGIGASLRTVMHNLSAVGSIAELAISPDQHLLRLLAAPLPAGLRMVAPHFFAFGGCLQTARWMQQVAAGGFEIDTGAGRFRLQN
jgi:methylenetetrahydrofolate reductase (NADPH)